MKNLAELKRIKVGTKLYLVHCLVGNVPVGEQEREVVRVQTNGMWLKRKHDGKESWLQFPKAKEFRSDENGFTILEGDLVAAQYRFHGDEVFSL